MTMKHKFRVKLSELVRRPVIDSDGIKVGSVEDIWLEEDGSIWLVVGGNVIDALMAKLHIKPGIDLLVPSDAVETVTDDEITLRLTTFQLEATCEECWTRQKEHLVRASTNPDRYTGLRLMTRGLWGLEPHDR